MFVAAGKIEGDDGTLHATLAYKDISSKFDAIWEWLHGGEDVDSHFKISFDHLALCSLDRKDVNIWQGAELL